MDCNESLARQRTIVSHTQAEDRLAVRAMSSSSSAVNAPKVTSFPDWRNQLNTVAAMSNASSRHSSFAIKGVGAKMATIVVPP